MNITKRVLINVAQYGDVKLRGMTGLSPDIECWAVPGHKKEGDKWVKPKPWTTQQLINRAKTEGISLSFDTEEMSYGVDP